MLYCANPLSKGSVDYAYDENSRLDSETGIDYEYDWVGNRLNPPTSPGPMQYDDADQLTVWPGQHQYTYLDTGSLFRQLSADGNTVEKEYTYTYANLLSEVEHLDEQGTPSSTMVWDGDSNRVSFTSSEGTGTWYFVYDTTAGIQAVIEEVTPSGSVYYIREPNGALIARDFPVGVSRSIQYYHFDALRSTRALTDDDGDVTDTYSYDAWGNTTHSGSTEQPYQYVGQLGYYTHYQDENLDLLQLGVRFYDPQTGRFTQRDPVRSDTFSTYPYSRDRPTVYIDASGQFPWAAIIIGGFIIYELANWIADNYLCGLALKTWFECAKRAKQVYPNDLHHEWIFCRDERNDVLNSCPECVWSQYTGNPIIGPKL